MFLTDTFNDIHYPLSRVMNIFHDNNDTVTPCLAYLIMCFFLALNSDNREIRGLTYDETSRVYTRLMRKYGDVIYHDINSDKVYSVEYLKEEYFNNAELMEEYECFHDYFSNCLDCENGSLEVLEG